MSYRDGYDFRKWYAGSMRKRPRRYWVRWGLTAGLAFVLAIPVLAMLGIGERSAIVPNVMPMSMLLFIRFALLALQPRSVAQPVWLCDL